MNAGTLLRSHLHHAIVLARGFHHQDAFVNGVADGLFNVNILAGLAGLNHHQRVPVVGSTHDDDIDIFAVEHLAEIGVGLRLTAGILDAQLQVGLVNVADGGDFNVGLLSKCSEVAASLAACANNTHNHLVTGGRLRGFAQGRESDSCCCRSNGGLFQKLSAVKLFGHDQSSIAWVGVAAGPSQQAGCNATAISSSRFLSHCGQ